MNEVKLTKINIRKHILMNFRKQFIFLFLAFVVFAPQSYALIWSSGNANVAKIYSIEYPLNADVGAVITINGTGFVSSTRVLMGGVSAITWNILSATKMTAVIPTPSNLGSNTKDITLLSQADNKTNDLVYKRPSISGVNPSAGSTSGGTIITITGSGFAPNASVFVSGNAATNVHFIDSTQITATIPASIPANTSGNATITVINPSGFSGQATGVFAYLYMYFATGGTITESGGYRIHRFTSSGTFTVNRAGNVEYLVVAGGGSGGPHIGGGGGAGGVLSGVLNVTVGGKTVTIGAGGIRPAGYVPGTNGNNSIFDSITAIGGGGGGTNGSAGYAGGCGGGGGHQSGYPGYGGAGSQGYKGGDGGDGPCYGGGGGGGKGASGINSNDDGTSGGNGGNGISNSISGTSIVYGGGGGGGRYAGCGNLGIGGSGGGGNGGVTGGGHGATNTGGGGGGGSNNADESDTGNGGSGIVIVRYPIGQ